MIKPMHTYQQVRELILDNKSKDNEIQRLKNELYMLKLENDSLKSKQAHQVLQLQSKHNELFKIEQAITVYKENTDIYV